MAYLGTHTNTALCTECVRTIEVPKEIGTTQVDLHIYVIEQNVRCLDCGAQSFVLVDY